VQREQEDDGGLAVRITTTTVNDFLANLEAGEVWEKRIYFERSSRPLNGRTKQDATSFEVHLQLSAVVAVGEGQALLACGTVCGVDRLSGDGGLEGTTEQERLLELVKGWCGASGVRMLPGVLDQ
jgi:hypothetical protein